MFETVLSTAVSKVRNIQAKLLSQHGLEGLKVRFMITKERLVLQLQLQSKLVVSGP